jgi:ubiquitin-protein ligase
MHGFPDFLPMDRATDRNMHASPRVRRLRNDLLALEKLRDQSSVFSFKATGNPPHQYQVTFKGRGLWRDRGRVKPADVHHVEIRLGASYPRMMPEIRWVTPIYHPNISEIGMVCLGGYATSWVPSVQLDELCGMLWDMVRYHNYDIRSPYNRDSAHWAASQEVITFPTDPRPIRDLRAAQGRIVEPTESADSHPSESESNRGADGLNRGRRGEPRSTKVRRFAHLYKMIFGAGEDEGVRVESVSNRSRPSRDLIESRATAGACPKSPAAPAPRNVSDQDPATHEGNSGGGDGEEILFIG